MTTPERRRIISTAYRIIASREEEQARAIDRLTSLTDFSFALEVWLTTKPDPALVEAIVSYRVLQSPLRSVYTKKGGV